MKVTELAKDALQLCWRRKYLWVFGVFVAAGGGGGAGAQPGDGVAQAVPTWVWFAAGAAVLVGVVMLVLHVLSEAALIASVRKEHQGERSTVRSGFREGARHFWKVLGLKAGTGAAALVTLGLIAAPALLAVLKIIPLAVGIGATLIALVPAIPWLLTVFFAYQYALRFAVLDGASVSAAVKGAWAHLHGRLAESLQLLALSLMGRVGASVLMFVALLPGVLVGAGVFFASGLVPALIAGGVVALPFVIAVMGAEGTFQSSVWTLGFLDSRREVA